MDLEEIRNKIDSADREIVRLFRERMELASEVAAYKKENGKPVYDPARERALLRKVADLSGPDMEQYTLSLYQTILELSKSYQHTLLSGGTALSEKIKTAADTTPKVFPKRAHLACQGVEGAYSQIACDKLFKTADISYFKDWEGVFTAVENGECDYGVLPIENSIAGSVNKVYDLMAAHNFSIVRSTRIKIDHNLLAKKGAKISDIKEIYSHEQAVNQCSEFLSSLPNVKVNICANTAMAAKMVAESDRNDIGALSSRECISLYGLDCLAEAVQDKNNNHTRFICISKNLEIYPGADRTSIIVVAAHRPGSLYSIISKFNALGLNLLKLESRPIPGRDFEFMFYFDFEASVNDESLGNMLSELENSVESLKYLGTYSEVI